MRISFSKMHGAGNDYIYINCLQKKELADVLLANATDLAVKLSDRHKGIGADGIVLLCNSTVADAKMRMFNADGSEGKMCGNAIRCVAKYLYDNKLVHSKSLQIETLAGIKTLTLTVGDDALVKTVCVDMGKADFLPQNIPMSVDMQKVVGAPLLVDGKKYLVTCLSMGNPHCVVFLEQNGMGQTVQDLMALDLATLGRKFERHALFPERVNTEFVVKSGENQFAMRVWERGSGETMACGTGACAVVAAAIENQCTQPDVAVTVELIGGNLKILIDGKTNNVQMIGDAVTVFEGEIEL